jgi:hypothetical protein
MSYTEQGRFSNQAGREFGSEAEVTLRLIASLPAPVGLEERVHAGLRNAPVTPRVLAWPAAFSVTGGLNAGGWLRGAAAAAIVVVVAGGSWGIYARVQPGLPAHGVAGPRMLAPGSFSETGAERRPHTVVGPVAPAAVTPAAATQAPKAAAKPMAPATLKTKAALAPKPVLAHAAPPQ